MHVTHTGRPCCRVRHRSAHSTHLIDHAVRLVAGVQVSHLEGKHYDLDSNLIKAYSNEVRERERERERGQQQPLLRSPVQLSNQTRTTHIQTNIRAMHAMPSMQVVATIRELVKVNPLFKEHFNFYTQKIEVQDPFKVRTSRLREGGKGRHVRCRVCAWYAGCCLCVGSVGQPLAS